MGTYELVGGIFMFSLSLCFQYDNVTTALGNEWSWSLVGIFFAQIFWPVLLFVFYFGWTFLDGGSIDMYDIYTETA